MFKKYFRLLHEKIYFFSFLLTFIGLLLPWFRGLIYFIPGIILPFGSLVLILLTIHSIIFFWTKRRQKVLSVSSIVIGSLCLLSEIGHLVVYQPAVNIGDGLYGVSMGVYVGIIGSLGILISGVLGLKQKKQGVS
jgi:hypothetical protein